MARVAFISTMGKFPWGGSEYLWTATAKQALLEGHDVFVSVYDWSLSHPIIKQLQQDGAQLLPRTRLVKHPLFARLLKKLNQYLPLLALLQKSPFKPVFDVKPDVVCVSQGHTYDIAYTPDLLNLLNSSNIACFIVCQYNSDSFHLDSKSRAIAQEVFATADCIAFVSHHNLKLAERQLAQSLPNAVVVQNPVNMEDLSIVPFPQQSTINFANVARLDVADKGQDILLEALSSPVWRERNWQCHLYGSGPDQSYLAALAKHYNIKDRIHFMGHVTDIRLLWSENHILLLPSRAEGTPLSLIEAMLCGRPAVVTNVGGNVEWIEEGQTGFTAAATAQSFSYALEKAWQVQAQWKQLGIQAHTIASTRFDRSPGKQLLKMILSTVER